MKNISTAERNATLARVLVTNTKKIGDLFYEDRADDYRKVNRNVDNLAVRVGMTANLASKMLGMPIESVSSIMNSNTQEVGESEENYLNRITDMVIARVSQK